MKIAIINGPNLNKTGSREKDIYGQESFETFLENLHTHFPGTDFIYFQSNVEGEIINMIQQFEQETDGIIMNAGGYTHTSVALADAVKASQVQVVEVHISNIFGREEFRHRSLFGRHAAGIIAGFGLESYRLAAEYLINKDL